MEAIRDSTSSSANPPQPPPAPSTPAKTPSASEPHYRLHLDPRSSHQQILRHVRALGQSPILDVGAAQGMLGRQLQGSGLIIDGVELNPTWAKAAEPFYRRIFSCPIEEASLASGVYRTVVCGDVLEHTPDPVAVLRSLRAAAAPDATFVISLPNVTHLAVRLMLLFGYFPKMERGILDRTHLQFLTRDTAHELLRHAGLNVLSTSATGVPLDELWKAGQGKLLFRAIAGSQNLAVRLLPRLFGFQWVMTARAAG